MLTLIRELQRSQSRGLDLIVSLKTTDTAHLFTCSNFTALCTKLSPKQEQESSLLKKSVLCNTNQTFNNVWCPSWVSAYSAVTICASSLNSKRHLSGLYLLFASVSGPDVWPAVVGPRWPRWVGDLSPRCRLHLRSGHLWNLQSCQRTHSGVSRPSAGHGGKTMTFGRFFTARCHFYVKILCCLTEEWVWIFVYTKSPRGGFTLKKKNKSGFSGKRRKSNLLAACLYAEMMIQIRKKKTKHFIVGQVTCLSSDVMMMSFRNPRCCRFVVMNPADRRSHVLLFLC